MNYKEFASEVLSQYFISNQQIEYIRHNENITFKVTDTINNKNYILRIHKPVTEGLLGLQHSYEGLKSEIELLNALNKETELKVQKPVLNNKGSYITKYESDVLGSCYATLLEWLDGEQLTLEEEDLEKIAFSIGEKLGVLHKLFKKFKPSNEFVRPKYDMERLNKAADELEYGVEINLFTKENYDMMVKVISIVQNRLENLALKEDMWGIIHADVIEGNIIIDNGQASFIDFCLSGFGYYLFDLGSAATIFEERTLREAVIKGYASKINFSYENLRDIESLVFMDIFVSYTFFIRDENKNKWIKNHASKLCEDVCKDFVEGKEVFFKI